MWALASYEIQAQDAEKEAALSARVSVPSAKYSEPKMFPQASHLE